VLINVLITFKHFFTR